MVPSELHNSIYEHFLHLNSTERDFLHLTQVCRQIRSELRPLYMDTRSWIDLKACQAAQYLDAFLPGWGSPSTDQTASRPFTFIAIRLRCAGPRWSSIDPSDYPLLTLPDVQVKLVTTYSPYRGDRLRNLAYQWGTVASILFDGVMVLVRDRCGSWLRSKPDSFVQFFRVVLDESVDVFCDQGSWLQEHQCTMDYLGSLGIGKWDRTKCSIWLGLQNSLVVCGNGFGCCYP